MRIRLLMYLVAPVALVGSACITEQRPIINIALDQVPPDTVQEAELNVSGQVVRSPPDVNATFTVTAVVTNPTSTDTVEVLAGSLGTFTVQISIARDTVGVVNTVRISATDNLEESISQATGFTVVGLRDMPALRGKD